MCAGGTVKRPGVRNAERVVSLSFDSEERDAPSTALLGIVWFDVDYKFLPKIRIRLIGSDRTCRAK